MSELSNPPRPAESALALGVVPGCLRRAMEQLAALASGMNDALTAADRLIAQLPPGQKPSAAAAFVRQQVAVLETVRELEVVVENLAKRVGAG